MKRNSSLSLLSLAALLVLTGPSFAQNAPAGQQPAAETAAPQAPQKLGPRAADAQEPNELPPPEKIGAYGKWDLQCGKLPAEGTEKASRQCGLIQITQNEKNKNVVLSLILVVNTEGGKTNTMMRVMVPVGVYLPTGVALEIDGAAVGRVPFTRCLPQVCEALAEASQETLAKMKKGKAANFIIYEAPGLGIPMKVDLKGFGQGLDELVKQSG